MAIPVTGQGAIVTGASQDIRVGIDRAWGRGRGELLFQQGGGGPRGRGDRGRG
jgi:hypothetical protein